MGELVSGRVGRGLAVVAGAAMMCWPAVVNGYPLLYPDSISYLGEGRPLWRALMGQRAGFEGMRSEWYSLGIFPWHWGVSPWGVVVLHALIMAWVIWLVVRSMVWRRTGMWFLVMAAGLSLLTSESWYVSLVMPDVLGAALYLGMYLVVFARGTLSKAEHGVLAVVMVWAVTAHATHLLLGCGVCMLLVVLAACRWSPLRGQWKAIGDVAAIVVVAAGMQMGLHGYLYGRATLSGNRVPYLMARVIADGPGRIYLEKHCPALQWAICERVGDLPDNDDDFLWAEGGVWASASPATQAKLLAEEMPLVVGTVREFPGLQMRASLRNFGAQLVDFGVDDFDNNTWMEGALEPTMPGSRAVYERSRQAHDAVPWQVFSRVQFWVVMASCVVVGWSVWRRRDWRLVGLAVVVVFVVVVNALVTAVLSTVDSRYESRVVWMLVLVAGLMLVSWRIVEHDGDERRVD